MDGQQSGTRYTMARRSLAPHQPQDDRSNFYIKFKIGKEQRERYVSAKGKKHHDNELSPPHPGRLDSSQVHILQAREVPRCTIDHRLPACLPGSQHPTAPYLTLLSQDDRSTTAGFGRQSWGAANARPREDEQTAAACFRRGKTVETIYHRGHRERRRKGAITPLGGDNLAARDMTGTA